MVSRTKKGFTIVELLIVIVVIAILAAISIVAYNNVTQKARDDQRLADARNIVNAAASFNAESETGAWPEMTDLTSYTTVKLSGTASSNMVAEAESLANDKYGYTKCSQGGVQVTYYKEAGDGAGTRQTITAGTCS